MMLESAFDRASLGWDNLVGAWDRTFGDDTPPPPTREAVEEHNRNVVESGADGVPLVEYDEDVAERAAEDYRRSQRSLVERVRDGARGVLDDARSVNSTVRWVSIAVVVLVVVGTIAAMTWWAWVWGPDIAQFLVGLVGGGE